MSNLIPFTYEGREVRVLSVDGEPWFVAADVARILNYRKASDMVRTIADDEKGAQMVRTPGGEQQATCLTEAGLYAVILTRQVGYIDNPEAKAFVRAFQRWVTHEVLPAIRRTGGYINANATEHQLNAAIRQAQMQMELCQAAKGLIHPDHLEARARVVLAKGLGEHAVLDEATRPLYTADYLKGKNLSQKRTKSVAPMFGKRVKAAYMDLHGVTPQRYPLTLPNGQTREVYAYTEADRPLMDRVWNEFYATQGVLA